ncbi:MAG: OmpA family protein [Alphaproteobacteria bacterium]|nr:OmpA family protein [Alphaproteobacteria bacterium]
MACRNARLLLLFSVFVLIGCADTGAGPAEADFCDVVRDTQGQIIRSANGTCVRTNWMNDRDVCAPETVTIQETVTQRVETRAAALTREERTVYFEFDRAALTPAARARLDTLADILKSDQTVKEARIVGYADRIGTISYNEKLSQARANAVKNYLVERGYVNARVTETRWVGKSRPTTHCPNLKNKTALIACLQGDRKVEVEIVFNPPSGPHAQRSPMPPSFAPKGAMGKPTPLRKP